MLLTPEAAAERESLLRALHAALGPSLPPVLGVAVSGGSDSMALLHLLHDLVQSPVSELPENSGDAPEGPPQQHPNQISRTELRVVTVDHRLRAESRQETHYVAEHAAALGLSCDVLTWDVPVRQGNLQDAARQARYGLLLKWAQAQGISAIAVGHTADDQAETVLMRLRRASGVTGLSGMSRRSQRDGIEILRPLLGIRRETLRRDLEQRGVTWVEDPSNRNRKFERIRMRDALNTLAPLGVTVEQLATVADNMQQAEAALVAQTQQAAQRLVRLSYGAVVIERAGFLALPQDIRRRLLLAALAWRAGPGYPPRRAPVQAALVSLAQGRGSTLAGCQILSRKGEIWIFRELQAVKETAVLLPEDPRQVPDRKGLIWDRVWEIIPPEPQGLRPVAPTQTALGDGETQIKALGDPARLGDVGVALSAQWRALDLPSALLPVSPALWRGEAFLSALAIETSAKYRSRMLANEFICDQESLSH